MNIKKENKGFTLIELVVVITILAILATVGFLGYSSYLPNARDTNRISQLEELSKGIQTYSTRHSSLPIPDNQIELQASGTVVAYQGEGGKNLLDTIGYNQDGVDPKDKIPFTYMVSSNRKAYQLMAMLESRDNLDTAFTFVNKTSAYDFSKRFPKVFGDHLGILTDVNNIPVNDIKSLQSSGYLDVVNTNNTYVAHITDIKTITGTGKILMPIALSLMNGKNYKSCKALYRGESLSHNHNNFYYIKPEGYSKFKIYCDMTTDGGGWTRYVFIKQDYTFKDARYCVDNLKKIDNDRLFCFYPRVLGRLKDYLYIDNTTGSKYELTGLDQPYNEKTGSSGNETYKSKYKHTLFDFVTKKDDPSVTSTWFGISYMYVHPLSKGGLEPGGMRADNNKYMNYDDEGKSGPSGSSWESHVRKGEFYVR